MIAKEWRDARWKFLIGALAFLVLVSYAPRPYERILTDVAQEIKMTKRDLKSPDLFQVPPGELPGMGPEQGYSKEQMRKDMRNQIERMKSSAYPVEMARSEIIGIHQAGGYTFMVALAGLLGVALVSGEVSRGTIFLLLSKPLSRTRMLLTKYSICGAVLLMVSLAGGIGAILSAYAHGYPSGSLGAGTLLASSLLFWLGSLFVLGVALLASVIFRDVIRSIIAAALSLYLVFSAPDLLRGMLEAWLWRERDNPPNDRVMNDLYDYFERFRLFNYWSAGNPYTGEWAGGWVAAQNALVCLIAAAVPLLIALWIFRRKTY